MKTELKSEHQELFFDGVGVAAGIANWTGPRRLELLLDDFNELT